MDGVDARILQVIARSMYFEMLDRGTALSQYFFASREKIVLEDACLKKNQLTVRIRKRSAYEDEFSDPALDSDCCMEQYTIKNGRPHGKASARIGWFNTAGIIFEDISCVYDRGKIHGALTAHSYLHDEMGDHRFDEFDNGVLKHSISLYDAGYDDSYFYMDEVKEEYDDTGNVTCKLIYASRLKRGCYIEERTKLLKEVWIKDADRENVYHVKEYKPYIYDVDNGQQCIHNYIAAEYNRICGSIEGKLIRYNEYEKVIAKEEYRYNELVRSTEYDPQTGEVLRTYGHKNGKKDGHFVDNSSFAENGSFVEGQYEEDLLEGDIFHKTSKDGVVRLNKVCSYHRGQLMREMTAEEYYSKERE